MKKVRVRFAPSPTGGLHLGGMRTALYNYLFARKHGGSFIIRIEDTDQTRFVAGAEEYISSCLEWCGMVPDESPSRGGPFGPYRQSERKDRYRAYAEQLIASGHAYYAFDTPEELSLMRQGADGKATRQYDHSTRMEMRNSLSLTASETRTLLDAGTPHVIRIRMEPGGTVTCNDVIRGSMEFDTGLVDDKVLLKADGMPTYHLAVVVDDYQMQISHVMRGEEWLPSTPVHVLLWEYLGWKAEMPEWVHLPLILKPDGHGKLSKRDGERLGFPVFALEWQDAPGFKELGFLPDAFVNMLAMLGWNDGSTEEIFSVARLKEAFSLEGVNKAGAKFDFDKAKWFNQQYIQSKDTETLTALALPFITARGIPADEASATLVKIVPMIKERCTLLSDFWEQGHFFFRDPEELDEAALREKRTEETTRFFADWLPALESETDWTETMLEQRFNEQVATSGIKKGMVMLLLRIMLVGGKYGPGVFQIASFIGREATIRRIRRGMTTGS